MIPLSEQTAELVWRTFDKSDWKEATSLLENECADRLPRIHKTNSNALDTERLRFAALKLSGGELEGLRKAIKLAKRDWRDLLMAAGFGDSLDAHKRWAERTLSWD